MAKLKVARKIPFFVNMTYNLKEKIVEQVFSFKTTNKKYLRYAYDQRFCLMRKIEKLIDKELLSGTSYLKRDEYEDKIVMTYRNDFGKFDSSSKIINCEFYLPPFNGCQYCANCEKQDNFLYCTLKKKHYDSAGIKSCPVFKSIDEILT